MTMSALIIDFTLWGSVLVLGFIGPLLVLLVTALFSFRTFSDPLPNGTRRFCVNRSFNSFRIGGSGGNDGCNGPDSCH